MTPAARLSAAIGLLDRIAAGEPAEAALTRWGRGNRYAGSGDRAAIRDLVYGVLRQKRSAAARGGGSSGRALVLGYLRNNGPAPETLFGAGRYAPAALSDAERRPPPALADLPRPQRLDYPDWLAPALERSLGARLEPVMARMRERAPVFLRVNRRRADRDAAAAALAAEGIATRAHPLCATALEVTRGARRIQGTAAWRDGLVELQDVASQAVVAALPLPEGGRILDYCAGGGGKALAMAAACDAAVFAHDATPRRMTDLAPRAARAGVRVATVERADLPGLPRFDLVLCDVPCSGSGAWRRDPAGKWSLNSEKLRDLIRMQGRIIADSAVLTAPGGVLAYATCSLLHEENEAQVAAFLAGTPGFRFLGQRRFSLLEGGDGMFVALLRRNTLG